MLEEYKKLYRENASQISGWEKLSKSELANLYIECEDPLLADAYLSAIMYKYWNILNNIYYKQDIKYASIEDCYNIVTTSIMAALSAHDWLDPKCSVYNDPKGPEKIMTKCIMCERANFYQSIKYQKRSLNYESYSIEELSENASSGYYLKDECKYDYLSYFVKNKVKQKFEEKDYFYALFFDAIVNNELFSSSSSSVYGISIKKWSKFLNEFSTYEKQFSTLYSIPLSEVHQAYEFVCCFPRYKTISNIGRVMNSLRSDAVFYDVLKGV